MGLETPGGSRTEDYTCCSCHICCRDAFGTDYCHHLLIHCFCLLLYMHPLEGTYYNRTAAATHNTHIDIRLRSLQGPVSFACPSKIVCKYYS